MRRRLLIAAVLLLAGLVGLIVWQALGPQEPVFEGRRLTRWLDHHVANSSAKPPYGSPGWKKADEALRHIGTNAVPTLLTMIRAKDPPPVVLKLIEFQRYRWTRINYRYARTRHEEAEYAFEVLGTNGVSAVPELIEIYEEAVSPSSQRCAALALGHIGRGAHAALPALLRNFHHTNGDVRFYAVSAVLDIGGDSNIVVPALKGMLKDPKSEVRFNAVAGLRRFGANARSAIPELLEAWQQDQDQSVKEEVAGVLWSLVPEKIAKPLVVEDPTPMVANGVTTEALSRTGLDRSEAKLWTLIPQGRRVRCVTYQSVITPLYLYRGLTLNTTNDHFLGGFEVVGIPTNSGVEVVYIIDRQQILLCARDHERKQFVELRRVENETAK